jgi:hypothetical protein
MALYVVACGLLLRHVAGTFALDVEKGEIVDKGNENE